MMVGISAGIPQDDLDLGDVVVADQIVGYDYGKITENGIKPRDRVYPTSTLLLDRIRNYWEIDWVDQVGTPRPANAKRARSKLYIGPIASGNKIIASTEFRQQLLIHWSKLVAVEMESEGVFALHLNVRGSPKRLLFGESVIWATNANQMNGRSMQQMQPLNSLLAS